VQAGRQQRRRGELTVWSAVSEQRHEQWDVVDIVDVRPDVLDALRQLCLAHSQPTRDHCRTTQAVLSTAGHQLMTRATPVWLPNKHRISGSISTAYVLLCRLYSHRISWPRHSNSQLCQINMSNTCVTCIRASDAAPHRLHLRSANQNRLTVPRCLISSSYTDGKTQHSASRRNWSTTQRVTMMTHISLLSRVQGRAVLTL